MQSFHCESFHYLHVFISVFYKVFVTSFSHWIYTSRDFLKDEQTLRQEKFQMQQNVKTIEKITHETKN